MHPFHHINTRAPRSGASRSVMYTRFSRAYDMLAASFEEQHRQMGVRLLDPHPGDTILEIGCGAARALKPLAQAVQESGRVYGLDISPQMLRLGGTRMRHAHLDGAYLLICAEARKLPFASSCVHGIFLSFTLELFDEEGMQAALAECWRTLQPGGRICVVAISAAARPTWLLRLYTWLNHKLPQVVDCRPILARSALEAHGFHLIKEQRAELFGLPIEIVLGEKPGFLERSTML